MQGRVVYFIDHGMTAVQLPAEAGEQIDARELWSEDLEGEFYASPLLDEGRIYTVDRTATCYVIDAATGKTLFSKVLEMPPAGRTDGPSVHASVCLAGKHLLLVNNQGNATVLEPGDKPGVVAVGTLPAGASGTPVFSGAADVPARRQAALLHRRQGSKQLIRSPRGFQMRTKSMRTVLAMSCILPAVLAALVEGLRGRPLCRSGGSPHRPRPARG